jgi:hypothetical protein
MRISIAFGFALGVLAFLTQDAAAQFMELRPKVGDGMKG